MREKETVIFEDGNVEVKTKRVFKRTKFARKISAVMPLLSLVAFLVLGFCFKLWHPGWVVFLSIPLSEIFIDIFNKRGKALWSSIALLVSSIVYVFLGFAFHAWHPGWLVFFLVPIVAILAE